MTIPFFFFCSFFIFGVNCELELSLASRTFIEYLIFIKISETLKVHSIF